MSKAIAGLIAEGVSFLVRVGIGLGKEAWARRQDRKTATRLSHADAERQAQSARDAGPPCRRVTKAGSCFLVLGHKGPCWFVKDEAGG